MPAASLRRVRTTLIQTESRVMRRSGCMGQRSMGFVAFVVGGGGRRRLGGFGLGFDEEHVDEEKRDDGEEVENAVLLAEDLLVGHGCEPKKIESEAETVDDPNAAL